MQTLTEPAATLGEPEDDRYTAVPTVGSASVTADAASEKTGGLASRLNAEGIIGRARTDAYDTAVRLRSQIAPHAAAGAILGIGLGADAIVASGGISAGAMALSLFALSGTTVGTLVVRARRRGSEWVRRIALAGLGASAWLTAAPFGVGTADIAVLVAGEYATAARWWQVNRPRYPDDATELDESLDAAEVEPEPLTPVERIIADWDEYIACQGGALHNSRLIAPEEHKHGFAFTLQLWRGRQTITTAIAALDKIAGGLDCGVDEIIVESHPLFKSTAVCRFQMITRSPIAGNVVFDGPRRRGGLLELGPYADGSGEALYRLYTPGSIWSCLLIGGTGIGKSRVVENIVISALSGGDTEYWYVDPNRGGSSPALAEHADWFATGEEAGLVLDAAIAILEARADENAVESLTGFTPSPSRPGLLIIVEECHNIFTQETAKRWARIAREGRKLGLALICVSQKSTLDTFGGDDAIRSSVMEGNALVLRSTSNQTGQMMPGLQVDPKTLPKIRGYAYVQGSEETGVRTAPFRNRNTEPDDGPRASYWLAAQPRPGLDVLSVTATLAAGTAYRDRHASTTTGRAGSRARVEALRNGHLPANMLKGPKETATAAVDIAQVVEFPAFRIIDGAAAPKPAARPSADGLTDSERAVLNAVAAGHKTPADIKRAVGLKDRQVAYLLKELVASGHLTQPKYGRYEHAA